MADKRKHYEVVIGGVPHTFLFTEEDAEKVQSGPEGGKPKKIRDRPSLEERSKMRTPANKARATADNK